MSISSLKRVLLLVQLLILPKNAPHLRAILRPPNTAPPAVRGQQGLPLHHWLLFFNCLFSTSDGTGKEAEKFLKRLAERLTHKGNTPNSKMASFVRKHIRFDNTKTILIALLGCRSKPVSGAAPLKDLDIQLSFVKYHHLHITFVYS